MIIGSLHLKKKKKRIDNLSNDKVNSGNKIHVHNYIF